MLKSLNTLCSSTLLQQVSRRTLSTTFPINQQSSVGSSSQSSDIAGDQFETGTIRRDINRAYLSGTVSTKPFYGVARNGRKYAVVHIVTTSFGGQYDFRVRLANNASMAYCRDHVHEGSRLFVFGRLATLPRTASDGSQAFSGTVVASRISVEKDTDSDSIDNEFDVDHALDDNVKSKFDN